MFEVILLYFIWLCKDDILSPCFILESEVGIDCGIWHFFADNLLFSGGTKILVAFICWNMTPLPVVVNFGFLYQCWLVWPTVLYFHDFFLNVHSLVELRTLTGKQHPQRKFRYMWKVWVSKFSKFIYKIQNFLKILVNFIGI